MSFGFIFYFQQMICCHLNWGFFVVVYFFSCRPYNRYFLKDSAYFKPQIIFKNYYSMSPEIFKYLTLGGYKNVNIGISLQ